MRDIVIVGGGHNGLITAALLARAGRKPYVLERSERVGGCAQTTEIAQGFHCPTLAHRASIDPAVITALGLQPRGWMRIEADTLVCAPTVNGRALTLWADVRRAVEEIARFSPPDAGQYPLYLQSLTRVGAVLRTLLTQPPPELDENALIGLVPLVRTVRKFRSIGRRDAERLLRWLPMAVADFATAWFESEPLRSTIAADGVLGAFLGPRSAGSTAALLLRGAASGEPIAPGWMPRGGMGALTDAIAAVAQRAGVEIRTNAEVRHILVEQGRAAGVVLASGEEIRSRLVVSNADPRHTFLGLVGPAHLSPDFVRLIQNIRMRGTLAKVNYAVSSLPRFASLEERDHPTRLACMSGCVRLCREMNVLERAFDAAKFGDVPEEPWIELSIPSIANPELAPAGGHVVSAYVQFAPFRPRDGSAGDAERIYERATRTIGKYAPSFEQSVVAHQTITPADLDRTFGLTGGQIFHGELALDQLFLARPTLGWARYRTPLPDLFLCGNGTHPGTGLNGLAGMLSAQAILKALRTS